MFSLACAQIAPKKGDLAANLDSIGRAAIQASEAGADLVIFPETSTSGYFLEGGVLEAALTQEELLHELASRLDGKLSKPLDLVLGFYQKSDGILYNAAGYFQMGPESNRIVHVYRKFFLPTYGVFDEERFVARGRELGVFDTRLGRVAILICEDLWHSIMPTLGPCRRSTFDRSKRFTRTWILWSDGRELGSLPETDDCRCRGARNLVRQLPTLRIRRWQRIRRWFVHRRSERAHGRRQPGDRRAPADGGYRFGFDHDLSIVVAASC